MSFMKLIINEIEKILKKRVVYIFFAVAIVSIIVSAAFGKIKTNNQLELFNGIISSTSKESIELTISDMEFKLMTGKELGRDLTEHEKIILNNDINIYKMILEKGPENIFTAEYKSNLLEDLRKIYEALYLLDEDDNKKEYDEQKKNIGLAWELLENGSFEEYVQFERKLINQLYDKKELTNEEYKQQMSMLDSKLKYEIGKYSATNSKWKQEVLEARKSREEILISRCDFKNPKIYLDDDDIENVKNQLLIDTYRLENNIEPHYEYRPGVDIDSYSRYNYNKFACFLSVIVIGLLLIILSCSTISDEISSGTIKFTLIAPYGRLKLLTAKLVSLLIVMIILVFLISQISIFIGNIAFGVNTNSYLYVKDSQVKVMSTYMYEMLQYILRMPELIIYLLLGVTLSTLIKNTTISIIISSTLYVGVATLIDEINKLKVLDFFKYLPFNNFDFSSKILFLQSYAQDTQDSLVKLNEMGLTYSILLLCFVSILLLITLFDSFRKKEI